MASRINTLVITPLAAVGALVIGWAGTHYLGASRHSAGPEAAAAPIIPRYMAPDMAESPRAAPVIHRAAPARASVGAEPLRAELIVGTRAYNPAERIALPDGTAFQLRLSSATDGVVQIEAINPDGESTAAPLWTGFISAAGPTLTPRLRLEGTQGLETLRIRFSAQGPGSHHGKNAQIIQIWHL